MGHSITRSKPAAGELIRPALSSPSRESGDHRQRQENNGWSREEKRGGGVGGRQERKSGGHLSSSSSRTAREATVVPGTLQVSDCTISQLKERLDKRGREREGDEGRRYRSRTEGRDKRGKDGDCACVNESRGSLLGFQERKKSEREKRKLPSLSPSFHSSCHRADRRRRSPPSSSSTS